MIVGGLAVGLGIPYRKSGRRSLRGASRRGAGRACDAGPRCRVDGRHPVGTRAGGAQASRAILSVTADRPRTSAPGTRLALDPRVSVRAHVAFLVIVSSACGPACTPAFADTVPLPPPPPPPAPPPPPPPPPPPSLAPSPAEPPRVTACVVEGQSYSVASCPDEAIPILTPPSSSAAQRIGSPSAACPSATRATRTTPSSWRAAGSASSTR